MHLRCTTARAPLPSCPRLLRRPLFHSMHHMGAQEPFEEMQLSGHCFSSLLFESSMGTLPAYSAWYREVDQVGQCRTRRAAACPRRATLPRPPPALAQLPWCPLATVEQMLPAVCPFAFPRPPPLAFT